MRVMKEKGIDLRLFFYPLSSQPAYSAFALGRDVHIRNSVSYRVSPYGVNLQSGMSITCESVNYVCAAVKGVMGVG